MKKSPKPAREQSSPAAPPKPAAPAAPPAAAREKRPKAAPAKPGRERLSGLDAAAKVLSSSRSPMRCGDIAKAVIAKGLWKTDGKTPAATLNAAIIREIRAKGKQSRFRKTDRGLFAAAGK